MAHQVPPPPSVRPMGADELQFVVEQHRRHFPEGFFARLGEEFLEEYYRTFVTSPYACLLTAEDLNGPSGYIAGITDPASHRAHLLQAHRRRLITCALKSLARRPSLLLLFLRTRAAAYARKLMPLPEKSAATNTQTGSRVVGDLPAPAVLSHLVVDPSSRCQGVGRRLVGALTQAAEAQGKKEMVLVTEPQGLGEGFYRHLGWRHTSTRHTRDGRTVLVFATQLPAQPISAHEEEADRDR